MTKHASMRRMMVDTQVRPSDVTKYPVIGAMLSVPREAFVPVHMRDAAYMGENVPLAERRVVLEPRTLAKMLDGLAVDGGDLVLDVGAGLGYSSAVIAHMAEAVVALEEDPEMAGEARTLLVENRATNVVVQEGALAEGAAEHGPFDAIVIEGGAERLPDALAAQLKEGGRIACLFMEGALGAVRMGHKSGGAISWRFLFNASAPVLPGFEIERTFKL